MHLEIFSLDLMSRIDAASDFNMHLSELSRRICAQNVTLRSNPWLKCALCWNCTRKKKAAEARMSSANGSLSDTGSRLTSSYIPSFRLFPPISLLCARFFSFHTHYFSMRLRQNRKAKRTARKGFGAPPQRHRGGAEAAPSCRRVCATAEGRSAGRGRA